MSSRRKTKHFGAKSVPGRNASNSAGDASPAKNAPNPRKRRLKAAEPELDRAIRHANLIASADRFADATLPDQLVDTEIQSPVAGRLPAFPTVEELERAIASLPEQLAAFLSESLQSVRRLGLGGSAAVHIVASLYNEIRSDHQWVRRAIQLSKKKEIGYLRECEAENCGLFFFAGRHDQRGHSKSCANKIRKQEWRERFRKGEPSYHKE